MAALHRRFRIRAEFPLQSVQAWSTDDKGHAESLIILSFRVVDDGAFEFTCRWPDFESRERCMTLLCLPDDPEMYPVRGVELTKELRGTVTFGSIDPDAEILLCNRREPEGSHALTGVSRSSFVAGWFSRSQKQQKTALLNYLTLNEGRPRLPGMRPCWCGPTFTIPTWALVMTELLFDPCETYALAFYRKMAEAVTPTSKAAPMEGALRVLRTCCFPSRAVASLQQQREWEGDLTFFRRNDALWASCEMAKVLYSYHCARCLRRAAGNGAGTFNNFRECVVLLVDGSSERWRPALGFLCRRWLDRFRRQSRRALTTSDVLDSLVFQVTDDDLTYEGEEQPPAPPPCILSKTGLSRRLSEREWTGRFRVAAIVVREEREPWLLELRLKGESDVEIDVWRPSSAELKSLQTPLRHCLAVPRSKNAAALRLNLKGKLAETFGAGTTLAYAPGTRASRDSSDGVHVSSVDVWSRRDFVVFARSSDNAGRGKRRS